MRASNFALHVIGNNDQHLAGALSVAEADRSCTHWKLEEEWLVLYLGHVENAEEFLIATKEAMLFDLVSTWLRDHAHYADPEPTIDGSTGAGFELRVGWHTPDPPHVYEIFRIRKTHAHYHK